MSLFPMIFIFLFSTLLKLYFPNFWFFIVNSWFFIFHTLDFLFSTRYVWYLIPRVGPNRAWTRTEIIESGWGTRKIRLVPVPTISRPGPRCPCILHSLLILYFYSLHVLFCGLLVFYFSKSWFWCSRLFLFDK